MKFKGGGCLVTVVLSSLPSSQIYTVILAADIQHSTHSELSLRLSQQRANGNQSGAEQTPEYRVTGLCLRELAVDIVRKLNFFVGLLGMKAETSWVFV